MAISKKFAPGDKVYYLRGKAGSKKTGTVVNMEDYPWYSGTVESVGDGAVWAIWEHGDTPGWMPENEVFAVQEVVNFGGWMQIPADDVAVLDKYRIEYETRTVIEYRIKGGN